MTKKGYVLYVYAEAEGNPMVLAGYFTDEEVRDWANKSDHVHVIGKGGEVVETLTPQPNNQEKEEVDISAAVYAAGMATTPAGHSTSFH